MKGYDIGNNTVCIGGAWYRENNKLIILSAEEGVFEILGFDILPEEKKATFILKEELESTASEGLVERAVKFSQTLMHYALLGRISEAAQEKFVQAVQKAQGIPDAPEDTVPLKKGLVN